MKLGAKLHEHLHSKWFLTTSGSLAGVGWFLKDQWPQGTALHNACIFFVGLGLYLGTWSTTGRTLAQPRQEDPK